MHAVNNYMWALIFHLYEASKCHEINYNKGECRCLQLGSYSRLTDERVPIISVITLQPVAWNGVILEACTGFCHRVE